MSVTLRRLSGPEFSILAPRLVDIYIHAMGYAPGIRNDRIRVWRSEIYQPGFTAIVAMLNEQVVGVAYGFIGHPDRWWDQQLRRGFRERGGATPEQEAMLRDYFEVAEIHVTPRLQVRGIGRALLTELLWNAPASYAMLSTPEVPDEKNAAFGLYRSFGFEDVLRDFFYNGDARPFAILARPLPLPQQK
ncbi:GNAT family N-acetyltransferase [Corynebacterium pilosum]|uniref:Putative GCN5-related N-acetyltransferase n=1 Tax=Corynebacterium pilosum TaxID=35756 RepID=A0A376CJ20_9CORY|nr:GNAT family N-acetyltransferase [Corynebacterium pilosum]STC68424.1 putative GCN5-related N-acetyltransferase [Corynebacterium pilosum]